MIREATDPHAALCALFDSNSADVWDAQGTEGLAHGVGTAHGSPIAAYALAPEAGGIGPAEANAIIRLCEHAWKMGMPLVAINCVLAPRIRDGLEGIISCERIARQSMRLSERIAQIAVFTDPALFESAIGSPLADIAIAVGHTHLRAAHLREANAETAFARARDIVHLLPPTTHTYRESLAFSADGGDRELSVALCRKVVAAAPFDVQELIHEICDAGTFVELGRDSGTSIVTGLASIFGQTVGICADQTVEEFPSTGDPLAKAADIIELCNRIAVPVVNFVDTSTLRLAECALLSGLAAVRARQATGSTVTLIVRRCHGAGFLRATTTRPHHAIVAHEGAVLGTPAAEIPMQVALERGWIKKIVDPRATVEQVVHWLRWSRAERMRVTRRLRPTDPRLHNLEFDRKE